MSTLARYMLVAMALGIAQAAMLTPAAAAPVTGSSIVPDAVPIVLLPRAVSVPVDIDGKRDIIELPAGANPTDAATIFLRQHGYEGNSDLLMALQASIVARANSPAPRQ